MKLKQYILALGAFVGLSLSSCNDFLSTPPDDRTEINKYDDVRLLLGSAYPTRLFALVGELSSDNVVANLSARDRTDRFIEEVYSWDVIKETAADSPDALWSSYAEAVHTANLALEKLESMPEGAHKARLRGEALLCRAYGHFLLVNLFAQHYDAKTADQDLGIIYQTKPEQVLRPDYKRLSVAESYRAIERDLLEGLPLIDDNLYKNPVLHFNREAAYALAARFYLYRADWAKVVQYADRVLQSNTALCNYTELNALPIDPWINRGLYYNSPNNKNNLLLVSGVSYMGIYNSVPSFWAYIIHADRLSDTETLRADGAWGTYQQIKPKLSPYVASSPNNKIMMPKYPFLRQYTNPQRTTYVPRSTSVAFNTDELLLSRAEAYIHLGNLEAALKDMNTWLKNYYQDPEELTEQMIVHWNTYTPYHTATKPTPRKRLGASMQLEPKAEQYLQVLLHMRRIETLGSGLRWFDVKRYDIEIERVDLRDREFYPTGNILKSRDPRRALQIPDIAIGAGVQPNIR